MRVLVPGGAGFIGANFVRLTLETHPDAEVTVLDKLTYAGNRASLPMGITFVQGSIEDADVLDPLVAASDLVVNFAAETHNDNALRQPHPFVATNLVGTYQLLEAVRRHGVRLHHISTDEVFGSLGEADAPFTAQSPYNPTGPYAATKAGADLLVRAWVRSFGVAATITNCCNNYGPYQHVEKFIPRQITNLLDGGRGQLYGDGANIRDWVHVDDHNRAVWAVIDHGEIGQTYLISAGCQMANRDVLQLILELLGCPPDRFDLVADRPAHDRRYGLDAAQLRESTGWTPQVTDFHEGLAAVVAWYKANEAWWRPLTHQPG